MDDLKCLALRMIAEAEINLCTLSKKQLPNKSRISINGESITIAFNLCVIGTRQIFHLFIQNRKPAPLDEEIVDKIVLAFFDRQELEIPTTSPEARQFIKYIREGY